LCSQKTLAHHSIALGHSKSCCQVLLHHDQLQTRASFSRKLTGGFMTPRQASRHSHPPTDDVCFAVAIIRDSGLHVPADVERAPKAHMFLEHLVWEIIPHYTFLIHGCTHFLDPFTMWCRQVRNGNLGDVKCRGISNKNNLLTRPLSY